MHITVGLLVIGGGMAFLFWQRTTDVEGLGRIIYKWRWGRAAEASVDANRDGLVDYEARFTRWSTDFTSHEAAAEIRESSLCDGRFDRSYRVQEGRVDGLSVDKNRDGVPDLHLTQADAREYLRAHPRAVPCRWKESGKETQAPGVTY